MGGGAFFPPNPVTTSADSVPKAGAAPKLELGAGVGDEPKPGAALDTLPNPLPLAKGCDPHELVTGAGFVLGTLDVVDPLLGNCNPPLLAPPSFSCVRP